MDEESNELEKLRKQWESDPNDPQLDNVGALSRYFIWSDKLRRDFYQLVTNEDKAPDKTIFLEHVHIYMSYWYSSLYVLIEGWHSLGLQDKEIDRLLASPYVDLLRRYRNAVFHFQKRFSDKRFIELMLVGREGVDWVRQLHGEFGRFFLVWWKARRNPPPY